MHSSSASSKAVYFPLRPGYTDVIRHLATFLAIGKVTLPGVPVYDEIHPQKVRFGESSFNMPNCTSSNRFDSYFTFSIKESTVLLSTKSELAAVLVNHTPLCALLQTE